MMDTDDTIASTVEVTNHTNGFNVELDTDDQFGYTLSHYAHSNGSHFLGVGTLNTDDALGRVYFMRITASGVSDVVLVRSKTRSFYGNAVAFIGDVNGDGKFEDATAQKTCCAYPRVHATHTYTQSHRTRICTHVLPDNTHTHDPRTHHQGTWTWPWGQRRVRGRCT